MGLLDTLFGRREQPAAKAVLGTGAYWMEHGVPLRSISRDPARLSAEAQRAYHTNEWVHAAESLIDAKFATVPWHLEDRDGETVPDDAPQAQPLLNLLRNPSTELTRSHLWRLTCRHLGLTGNAFWVLDQQDVLGVPERVIYLNPARLTPATSPNGVLQGWIVDADRPDGRDPIPLTLEEVIHFVLEPPDFGYFGIGKVEAAWRKITLGNATTSYAEGSLRAGGRKGAFIWPDGVTVEGEQWDQWVGNLRSVQEEGSFSRRIAANPFPLASLDIGQTSEQLKLPELNSLSRDDLLAIWGVPPSQLGIAMPAGLNSGEKGKFEEAALWQNAVEPRLTTFAEQLQNRLISPFGYTLILETPEFDDEAPLYEIASKAVNVPLKVDERRALVGLDPLDETVYGQLGQMILINQSIVELSEAQPVPDNLVPFTGQRTDNDAGEMPQPGEVAGKARLVFTDLRNRIEKQYVPRLERELRPALDAQRKAIANAVIAKHGHLTSKPTDEDAWWNTERENRRLAEAISPTVEALILDSGRRLRSGFFASAKADNFIDRVLDYVRVKVGDRIRGINDTTRAAVRGLIADGIAEGLSPRELGDRIEAATAWNENRAELIARTETALAYNDTAIGTYRAFDVGEVQAIDGDKDDECASRNGQVYSISEASAIYDHPNGTLDWVPIVKAEVEPNPMLMLAEANTAIAKAVIAQPAPVVHVYPPDPAQVTVNVPEQRPPQVRMDAPVVNVHPAPVTVNMPKPGPRKIIRNAQGEITEIKE
jgi:phage portal protein BeeE